MDENDVEQAVIHPGMWGKVHSSACESPVCHDHSQQLIRQHVFPIDFKSDDLFPMAGCHGNRCETESQETAHPLVMRLEPLDDDR